MRKFIKKFVRLLLDFFANKQAAHTHAHTQTSCKSNRSKGNNKNNNKNKNMSEYNNNGNVKLNNSHGSEFFTIFAFCRRHRESLWLREAQQGIGRECERERGRERRGHSVCAAIAWLVDSACFSPILLKRKI